MFGRTKTGHEPARTADDETQAYPTTHREEHAAAHHDTHPSAYGDRHAYDDRDDPHRHDHHDEHDRVHPDEVRRDRFGGVNWGAGFFGWLVAVAVTVLLAGIIGAVAAGTTADEELLPTASTTELGLAGIIALGIVLLVAYYAGGYVAGRMSRYDGPRQGFAVWLIGVLMTVVAVAAGAVLGSEYDVMERINMPTVPLSTDTMTTGGIVVAAIYLAVTLLAAMAGAGVGRHYHARVDRYV